MLNKMLNKPMVVCYGEILWDILPSVIKPGGAPMNVAYHLNQMEIDTQLISRIGKDQRGNELLDLLKSWDLSTNFCQIDSKLPTSEVHAVIGGNHEVSYDICYPVAWDHISFQNNFSTLLTNADALVFGSLSSRDSVSRKTLFQMLEISKFNVLDINLRAPHYSPQIISELLEKTNLLKLNKAELLLITDWFKSNCKTEKDCVNFLQNVYKINEVIVTKGEKGATYYTTQEEFDCPAYSVSVADTVGAGDAFLAAFLAKKLTKEPTDTIMSYASALGAFVTKHSGACPPYSMADLENFMTTH